VAAERDTPSTGSDGQSTSGPPAPHLVHAATVLREVLERKHPEQRWIVEVKPRD
jgi:hypothetical protein